METIKEQLAEIFEVDTISNEDILTEFEAWDSLTILSIIALAGEECNVILSANEINDTKTVEGLCNLIQSKK